MKHGLIFLSLFTGQEEEEAQVYDFVNGACEKKTKQKKLGIGGDRAFFLFLRREISRNKRNHQQITSLFSLFSCIF